ncbi:MAG: helix-turn-helix domain-containing protein [Phascolarctobacterium sp.]|nr:helix-turn-helix domain-containing protein [Phascolarctobacterium sp.]
MFGLDESRRRFDDVLTVTELMDFLAVGKNTAYKLLRSGEIKSFRIGRNYKIPKESVMTYIHRNGLFKAY